MVSSLHASPIRGAPYFIVNVDRNTGRSDLVTSGSEGEIETHYMSQSVNTKNLDVMLSKVIDLGRELMHLTRLEALDIEFGIDQTGSLYLFQVRPIIAFASQPEISRVDFISVQTSIRSFIKKRMKSNPRLLGETTVFGSMPDWNPAEMIGRAPRSLALSLYQDLIGDTAWSEARAEIGYRNVSPEPLILSIGGQPFVDVRCSLNSFLPKDLDAAVGKRWTDKCIAYLSANPVLHDKIEFDVAVTCLTPDWLGVEKRLIDAKLNVDERAHF